MNCDGSPNLAWTQQDLYLPQQTLSFERVWRRRLIFSLSKSRKKQPNFSSLKWGEIYIHSNTQNIYVQNEIDIQTNVDKNISIHTKTISTIHTYIQHTMRTPFHQRYNNNNKKNKLFIHKQQQRDMETWWSKKRSYVWWRFTSMFYQL